MKVLSCNGWCQIAYNGQKGWVYKNFLAGSSAKPQKQQNAGATSTEAASSARVVQSPRLN